MSKANQDVAESGTHEVVAITPMHMLQVAVEKGHDLEKIEKLMELERCWKADQAREAYYLALAEFKKEPVTVTKDKVNTQFGSMYTGLGNLANTVNAAMAPFGLNASWDFDQSDGIKVTCILAHTLGHTQSVSLSGPPDDSGSKNKLQQIKSTVTYLEGATFQAVTGVVSQDSNGDDDDGKGAGNGYKRITEDQIKEIQALLDATNTDQAKFLEWCEVDSLEDIPSYNFKPCIDNLKRKKKLQEKQAESA